MLYAWIYVSGMNFEVQSYRRVDLKVFADLLPHPEETEGLLHQEIARLNGGR